MVNTSRFIKPMALKNGRGYSLIEMAVVLVIIGLIYSAGSYVLPWFTQSVMNEKTRLILGETKEAIITFSLTNNRLPCPDMSITPNGMEDCAGGAAVGGVPYATLLLSAPVWDATHKPVSYSVFRDTGSNADLAALANLVNLMDETSGTLNVYDFCAALNNASPTAGTACASVSTDITGGDCSAGTFINQAFVLASSGFEDADGDANVYDGLQDDALLLCFASPYQGRSAIYDDLTLAMSFSDLAGMVCPEGVIDDTTAGASIC